MTKQQEIARLHTFTNNFPPGTTYCGAWLHSQINALETCISNDHFPEVLARTPEEWAKEVADNAGERAAKVIEAANREADRIKREAETYARETREAADSQRDRIIRELEQMLHTAKSRL